MAVKKTQANRETGDEAAALPALFCDYQIDAAYDEMLSRERVPRAAYEKLYQRILKLAPEEFHQRQQAADLFFLNQGITFTVYGHEEGTERVFPTDLLPRIITADEWRVINDGLTQRINALNLFLKDIYHAGRIFDDGVVPRDMIYSCRHYRPEMRGINPPRDVYVAISGSDLVRLDDGRFAVLEDNLRVPSGVSYMLANREVMKRLFPQMFLLHGVRPVDNYCQALLSTLRSLSPPHRPNPTIVLLTPGVFNSAYFEHTYLARQMGIELVEGRDLLVHDNVVYMRTTAGLERVDAHTAAGAGVAFDVGIALHFGEPAYGNVGSGARLDYTVIGRDVNLAARVAGLCGSEQRRLLVSQAFQRHIAGADLRPLGTFALKGLPELTPVFEPAGEASGA